MIIKDMQHWAASIRCSQSGARPAGIAHFAGRALPIVLLLLIAGPAMADTIVEYQIGPGTAPGFSGSWLHTASSHNNGGYWMGGSATALTGMLTGTWDGTNLSGVSGTLTAGAGTLTVSATSMLNGGAGTASGTLDYNASGFTGTFANINGGGAFGFATAVGPSIVSQSQIILWGQNFAPTNFPPVNSYGIDLYGTGTVASTVPELPTGLLIGFGLAGLIGASIRRKRTGRLDRYPAVCSQ